MKTRILVLTSLAVISLTAHAATTEVNHIDMALDRLEEAFGNSAIMHIRMRQGDLTAGNITVTNNMLFNMYYENLEAAKKAGLHLTAAQSNRLTKINSQYADDLRKIDRLPTSSKPLPGFHYPISIQDLRTNSQFNNSQ